MIDVFCWLLTSLLLISLGVWMPWAQDRLGACISCTVVTLDRDIIDSLRYRTWQNPSLVPLMEVPVSFHQIDVFLLNVKNSTSSTWSKLVILGFFPMLRAVNLQYLQKWVHHLGWDLDLSERNWHVPIYLSGNRVSLMISVSDLMGVFLGEEEFLAANYFCLISLHPLLQA